MRKLILVLVVFAVFTSCQENEPAQSDLTGTEVSYALQAGSTYPISGTATFKERKDGTTLVSIKVQGTEGSVQHPVHLHLGNIASPSAEISALLTPIVGKTGISETVLSRLADESPITYNELKALSACIKIHLSSAGPDKDVILAAGNIGEASKEASTGRLGISTCKSE